MPVRIQVESFNPGSETNAFLADSGGAGAAVAFTGLVRSLPDDPVKAMTLECYPELAQRQIERIVHSAMSRFGLIRVTAIHRYGRLLPGEPIVQVMTLASHREAAFKGAEFLMDYLKTDAPFWKNEETAEGSRWVEARAEDDSARDRWQ